MSALFFQCSDCSKVFHRPKVVYGRELDDCWGARQFYSVTHHVCPECFCEDYSEYERPKEEGEE